MDVIDEPDSPGHNNGGGSGLDNLQNNTKDKETEDRLIAAEVMTGFFHYATQSSSSCKQKSITTETESSINENSNITDSSRSGNLIIATTNSTDSNNAATNIQKKVTTDSSCYKQRNNITETGKCSISKNSNITNSSRSSNLIITTPTTIAAGTTTTGVIGKKVTDLNITTSQSARLLPVATTSTSNRSKIDVLKTQPLSRAEDPSLLSNQGGSPNQNGIPLTSNHHGQHHHHNQDQQKDLPLLNSSGRTYNTTNIDNSSLLVPTTNEFVLNSNNSDYNIRQVAVLNPRSFSRTGELLLSNRGGVPQSGNPQTLIHGKKQLHDEQQQEVRSNSGGRTLLTNTKTSEDNFPILSFSLTNESVSSSYNNPTRKSLNNSYSSVEPMIIDQPSTNEEANKIIGKPDGISSHNKNSHETQNLNIININNSSTAPNNNKQLQIQQSVIRKKSLPILNARILKELLDSTNNQGLVYLIHPFHDNFLVRSINKKDFINSFLKVKQKLTGNSISGVDVFEPQITPTSTENENPIWGIIKQNGTLHFFEPSPKENKELNNSTTLTEKEGNTNKNSENNLSNSVILNNSIPEPSSNEKLTSTLPLKKRKVAESLLSNTGIHDPKTPAPPSSPFLGTSNESSGLLKSVSQLAEECIRHRSIFIVSPSDVPKFVKTLSSSKPVDESSNQQLTKNIEIALHQDEDGDLPLHIAAVQKDLKMVSLYGMLIQRAGKSVDRFNKKHLTPLHFCVKVKFLEGIKKLIQMGADVNTLDGKGQSALHIAVTNSDLESFDFMLQQCLLHVKDSKMKPNLNSHDYEGLTLLHTAVNNNNIEMIERLLEKGAEIDEIDLKSGRTPMFFAVENNNIEIVKFLLEKRANIDEPNFAGNTAFVAASFRDYNEISKYLADNGADTKGLLTPEETTSNPKTTSAVKNQLKNKLVLSKANQTVEAS